MHSTSSKACNEVNRIPAEAAGIKVEGENPWIVIIQNASREEFEGLRPSRQRFEWRNLDKTAKAGITLIAFSFITEALAPHYFGQLASVLFLFGIIFTVFGFVRPSRKAANQPTVNGSSGQPKS
jgi:hypothetical protein